MIFRFIKQIAAPRIFSKAVTQYQQGQYGIASQLISKAGEWMPSLASDSLFQAASLLCDHQLNGRADRSQAEPILDELMASPHRDTPQYAHIIKDIKKFLDVSPPAA